MHIYLIVNKVNNKMYVGQTTRSPRQRFKEHMADKSHCTKLVQAVKKHGKENFYLIILDDINNLQELNCKEKEYIEKYNSISNGYNIETGGRNKKLTEEVKKKISKTLKGKSPTRNAIRLAIAENIKKVYQYDQLGNLVKEFDSITCAAKEIGITKGSDISRCCRGKSRLCMGYQWNYNKVDSIGKVREKKNPNPKEFDKSPKKPVSQIDSCGNVIKSYKSCTAAAADLGVAICSVARVCRNERKSIKGLFFRFN